jgi:NADPH:quinone reductase-like Zn-dependent oxidoreductase/acyl carrier protein
MAPSAEDGTWPRQLEIAERGAVEGLTLRPLNRAPLSEGDVEIEVRAAGLNFRDVLNVLGARDDAAALGGEVAGLISRLGAGVHDLTIGQAVVAVTVGGMGDYAVAPAILVLEKPENLTFAQAAASPLAFLTAQYALSVVGRMAAGERVLIHAAAGGVGMAAVALARHAGLEVFATAGSEAKREILRAMGIRHVFDSRSTAFAAAIALATGGEGIDLVLSAVTGPAIAASLKLLRRGGRFLEIGKAGILGPGEAERINPWATYHTIDLAPLIAREPGVIRPIFVDLMAKLAAGILPPPPVESFALADARLAFRHMARARHVGKIVLSMTRPGVVGTGGAAAGVVRPRPDATYLISGGLTGLGLACARRLVERGARHLVLFGRRSPGPDALTAVDAMREAGARVTVAQADAGSEADMRRLFEGVLREGPPLGGVIHAAGRLEDAVLSRQTWTRFSGVLAPKTRGAWLLHRLTAGMPLHFFVLFSSAAALLGAPGQSNHAAANAFLDGLAHYRRARGLPGLSINWGAWADIGAAAERNVAARIGKRGVGELSVEEGLRAFEYLLDRPPAQVGVIRADWPRVAVSFDSATENPFLDRLVNAPPLAVPEEPVSTGRDASVGAPPALAPTGIAPTGFDLMAAAPDKRAGLLTSVIRAEVAGVLGTANPNALSDRRPFRDMGLDSLMALELRTRLKKALSLAAPLPATIAFDYPSIADIVDFLMTDIYGWATPVPARADSPQDHAVLDDIEAMSDEDVDRLLALRARAS